MRLLVHGGTFAIRAWISAESKSFLPYTYQEFTFEHVPRAS
jgi:hypothetical protein